MQLTDEQQRVIDLVVARDAPFLACLTGGPGTGKTTTLRELLRQAGDAGLRAECAAPSGKAAQRMEEATGRKASTLHMLMRLKPGSTDYTPIQTDLLVLDESSMIDVPLMSMALQAAQAGRVRTVLLVGDSDQLPPVGPGQPFHDLLVSNVCPTVRLTQVHRQAQESGIVRAAHAIRQGKEPELDAPDFQLVECDELEDVPAVCFDVANRFNLNPDTSQILVPQRTNAGGGDAINKFVEEGRRPLDEGEPLVRNLFRQGTKIINVRNDYNLEVFNGELGQVVEARPGVDAKGNPNQTKDELHVVVGGKEKTYRGGSIAALKPAWALTVHKSQGSQWDDVIVVAHNAHQYMLTRRLLYVAVTRAAKRVWIVGQREAVAKAARNVRDARRKTWMADRFRRDAARAQGVA